ncbi:MAG: alpha/beta fold hydrolase [Sarcina sp.]
MTGQLKSFNLKEYKKINDIEQFLYHSGTSIENPVMLFIHGGPGVVESSHAYTMQKKWEEFFTVVHFDQRGSGKTLTKNPDSTPTMKLILEDVDMIIDYLRDKYNKEKIIIAGYSWGSVVGSIYAMNNEAKVLAYIGIGQVVDMMNNEKLLYKVLKNEFQKLGQKRYLKKLLSIGEYPEKVYSETMKYKYKVVESLQRKSKLAGGKNIFMALSFIKSPLFELRDLKSFLLSRKSNEKLMEFLINFNIYNYGTEFKMPVFLILGEEDWQVPSIIAKEYFKDIVAPSKELFIIEHAKHRPMIENKKGFELAISKIKEKL